MTPNSPEPQAIATDQLDSIFRVAIGSIRVGIVVVDPHQPDQPIVYVNDFFETMTGYSKQEVLGRNCRFLQGEQTAPEHIEAIRKSLRKQRPITIDLINYRKDGLLFWNELHISPILDERGELRYFIGIQRDVSERKRIQQNLQIQQLQLAGAAHIAKLGSWKIDLQRMTIELSQEHLELMGQSFGEGSGRMSVVMTLQDYAERYIYPEDHPILAAWFEHALQYNSPGYEYTLEYRLQRSDGELRNVLVLVRGNELESGSVYGTTQDITERKRIEQAFVESEAFFKAIFDSGWNYKVVIDRDYRIRSMNQMALDYIRSTWGKSVQAGDSIYEVIREQDRPGFDRAVERAFAGERVEHTVQIKWPNHADWFELRYVPVRTVRGDIIGVLLSHIDISERKRQEEQIVHLAYHDSLTGLPNRRMFQVRLGLELNRAKENNRKLAVALFDLDRFKLVNDTLGHAAGDRLLCEVSDRLSAAVREDCMLARLGGDEFVLLMPGLESVQQAMDEVRRLMEKLQPPIELENYELRVTTSVGISLYPEDGEEADVLLRCADMALYSMKEGGRNDLRLFQPRLRQRSSEKLIIEQQLRKALGNEQFEVYLQPIIEMKSGRVKSLEALVRWNSPELGSVPPSSFIPWAEETGIILALDEWVLRQACLLIKRWQTELGSDYVVNVNLSSLHIRHNLVGRICGILREMGVPGSLLNLEITETALMEDVETSATLLYQLKELGVSISIDDFGTGFSSLSRLKYFPISEIKIDRCFVQDMMENAKDKAIVSSIISLAHNLGAKVVAEGVERPDQYRYLAKLNCDSVQGFLLCRPQAADDITAFLRSQEPSVKNG